MRIKVVAFASASEVLGSGEIEVELPDGSGVDELRSRLRDDHPALEALWTRLAVAVDGELATEGRMLTDGCEVALLPPVSGG